MVAWGCAAIVASSCSDDEPGPSSGRTHCGICRSGTSVSRGGAAGCYHHHLRPAGSCAVLVDRDNDGDLDMIGIDELDDLLFLFTNP